MSRARLVLAIVAIVVVLFLVWLLDLLIDTGVFRSIEPSGPEPQRVVGGLAGGGEDVTFRGNARELFVSSADFRDPSKPGKLYLLDLDTGDLRDVTPALDFPLRPHGIDLWRGDGQERLFVVNHRQGSGFPGEPDRDVPTEQTIEIFDVAAGGTLSHSETVRGDALVSPNDVAAAGPRELYVTNDHTEPPSFWRTLTDYLRLPGSNVVHWDGDGFEVVLDELLYANGVAVSSDGRSVFVAETTGARVHWLSRTAEGRLEPVSVAEDLMGVDNISIGPAGDLWVAAHPKLLAFTAHAADPASRSPSQILHLTPKEEEAWGVQQIYMNDGDPISGASVAATNGRQVVVGSVFEHELLVLPTP